MCFGSFSITIKCAERQGLPHSNQHKEQEIIIMARYEHLPIYKRAFDLNVYLETVVRNFSRYHKYTLGTELRNNARQTVRLIIRANNTHDKLKILTELRELLEELKLTLRICKEVKAFNNFHSLRGSAS